MYLRSIVAISLLSLFSGCADKPQVVFKEIVVCKIQEKIERASIKLPVENEYANVAEIFSSINKSSFEFYESQVDRNNEMCINLNKDKK